MYGIAVHLQEAKLGQYGDAVSSVSIDWVVRFVAFSAIPLSRLYQPLISAVLASLNTIRKLPLTLFASLAMFSKPSGY
jgi:hypothetical protein